MQHTSKYQCSACQKCHPTAQMLKRHQDTVHKGELSHLSGMSLGIRPFACKHCPKAYTQKRYLIRHTEKEHTDGAPGGLFTPF